MTNQEEGAVVSGTSTARSVAPLCPRCEQGQVFPAKIAITGELVQVCEECEATWDAAEVLTAVRFRDFGTLLEERGLTPLLDELELPALNVLGQARSAVRAWQPPQPVLVGGTVTRHEHYGFYLDIGVEQDGLVPIIAIEDDPATPTELPSIGRVLRAALLGRTGPDAQPRLSIRPSDLAAARRAVGASPTYSTTGGEAGPELVLPDDFDEYGWEVEAKGCLLDVTVRWSGRDFAVSFYDSVRLAQDVAADLEQAGHVLIGRVVVVERVTAGTMREAARALPARFFDGSTA